LIVLVPLVMASIAVAYSFLQPSVYEASAKVLVGQEQGQRGEPAKVDDLQLIAESGVEVFAFRSVAAEAAARLDEPQVGAEDILANLTAEQSQSSQLILLTYTDTDPIRAQQIVNTVGEVGAERISTLPISANDIRATVVEAATVPTTAEEPDPLRNGLLAAGLGTMLGFGLAFVLESLDHNGRLRRKTK
jgi:capsular polysaccharide biosynthesis protein